MKEHYWISSTDVTSPVKNREVALFTAALQSPVTKIILKSLGTVVPASLPLIHNTGKDDPPDIQALDLGWECTEFPPTRARLMRCTVNKLALA